MRTKMQWIKLGSVAVIGAGSIVLLLLWLMGAFEVKVPARPPEPVLEKSTEPTILVSSIEVPVHDTAVGSIEPLRKIQVGSRLLAKIQKTRVEHAGQKVSAGEILFELEKADLEARLEEARAAHRSALASRAMAKQDLDRSQELFDQKIKSKEQLEQDQTRLDRAEADVQRASQAVAGAQTALEHATIRAPSNGTVVDKLVEAGDLAKPGQILVVLYDPEQMQLVASVREKLATRMQVGKKVKVRIDALGQTCEAMVSEIVPEAQTQSRSFLVKVTGECPPGVYSGMFGRLLIPVGTRREIWVPKSAVRSIGQLRQAIVVLSDGRTLRRFLRTGRRTESKVEVLSGLREGETILANASKVKPR